MERDTGVKSAAMNTIQFAFSDDVKAELHSFMAGDCNWVEMVNC
jgi:hypothetical protein